MEEHIPLFLPHSTPCLCVVHHLVFHDLTYYKETTNILPAPPNTIKSYTVCVETYASYMYAHTRGSSLCSLCFNASFLISVPQHCPLVKCVNSDVVLRLSTSHCTVPLLQVLV